MSLPAERKTVWMVAQYAMPPQYESRLRYIKFAHYLGLAGWDVKIFASSFMHNLDINLIHSKALYTECAYDDLNFVHIRTCGYRGHGLKRLISTIQFYVRFLRTTRRLRQTPDVIIGGLVPFGTIINRYAARVGAPHIVQIQDLWPQSMVDLGIVGPRNPVMRLLCRAEKKLYRKADAVIFSMPGGRDYICDKKWNCEQGGPVDMRKVHYINNGVDLSDFDLFRDTYILKDPDLNDPQYKKVVYIGSIQMANDIGKLIDAAALLGHRSDVKFLIYGDGSDRDALEHKVRTEGLSNIIFKEKWIDPVYVPYVLCQSSVNILNYRCGFGRYGGSQSKLFQYMASGRPICCNIEMPYCPIKQYDIGIARSFGSPAEYAGAIESLLDLDEEALSGLYRRSREAVREFDYPVLTDKLIDIMNKLRQTII